jgi:hypothetical protein
MTSPDDGYVMVEGEPRTRIGPAGVEPAYLVEIPLGWADDPPAGGNELQLSNLLPGRQGSSLVIIARTAVKEPLTLDLAERTVENSGERGRPRELRGSPQQRKVAGEPAIVFDQLEREPSPPDRPIGALRSRRYQIPGVLQQ